eukprot:313895-Pyramimonas_sp.AAC.1
MVVGLEHHLAEEAQTLLNTCGAAVVVQIRMRLEPSADKDSSNASHAQCIPNICCIPCAHVSRVSNRSALEQTGEH